MYRAFLLKINRSMPHRKRRIGIYKRKVVDSSSRLMAQLEGLLLGADAIDAESVSALMFPRGAPDVFLSHSYLDRAYAVELAAKMRGLGLNVFIDSEVWGSVYDLLRKIDHKFCWDEQTQAYSYEKRNRSTAHIYMILNSALQHMIDRSEAFIFVASNNSLVIEGTKSEINNLDGEKTASSWIHSELVFSSMVRRNVPERMVIEMTRRKMQLLQPEQFEKNLVVHHAAPLKHLELITDFALKQWFRPARYRVRQHPLDKLYKAVDSCKSVFALKSVS